MLEQLSITHLRSRLTDSLSGGQKQACVLAAMLALNTPILVLDEPTGALDPAGKGLVCDLIERLKGLGKTLVIGDQNLDWFQHLVDQALVLSRSGSLLFNGPLDKFLANRSLVIDSGIPVPSLTAVAYELQVRKFDVLPWVSLAEAQNWIAQHLHPSHKNARTNWESSTTTERSLHSVVEYRHVTYTYPEAAAPAIANVNLTASAGQLLGIIGQNGSGKSTSIRHLNGLLRSQEGTVTVAGQSISRQSVAQMAHWVGIVFQNPDLMLFNETVEQEAFYSLKLLEKDTTQRQKELSKLLEQFGLDEQRQQSPLALSVGKKQLLAILGALALDPKVLVLDEPTLGLDRWGRQRLSQVLQQLKTQGKAILCVSHDLSWLAEIADSLLVFDSGQVVYHCPTRELLADTALFKRLHIPLPAHIQLANEVLGCPCVTPTELAQQLGGD